jgi:hypothetical protein
MNVKSIPSQGVWSSETVVVQHGATGMGDWRLAISFVITHQAEFTGCMVTACVKFPRSQASEESLGMQHKIVVQNADRAVPSIYLQNCISQPHQPVAPRDAHLRT